MACYRILQHVISIQYKSSTFRRSTNSHHAYNILISISWFIHIYQLWIYWAWPAHTHTHTLIYTRMFWNSYFVSTLARRKIIEQTRLINRAHASPSHHMDTHWRTHPKRDALYAVQFREWGAFTWMESSNKNGSVRFVSVQCK